MVGTEAGSDVRNPFLTFPRPYFGQWAGEFATKNVQVSQRRKIPFPDNA